MCRFLAYVGAPVTVESLLVHPAHSLLAQVQAPRMQRHGKGNPDGFGVGWYGPGEASTPLRHRSAVPMWADEAFLGHAGQIRSIAILGHVRSATPGSAVGNANTHPFAADCWLFAHNGVVANFAGELGTQLRNIVSARRLQAVEGTTDSEVLFALTLDLLDIGAEPGEALRGVIEAVRAIDTRQDHRLNLVLTDGKRLAATACGDTLFVLDHDGFAPKGVVVASEPCDDHPAWKTVPDGSVVEATTVGPKCDWSTA